MFPYIVRTRRGLPALWEEGGGRSNTGVATIIAAPDGGKLRPVYVNRRGHLACGQHALFIVRPSYVVVLADHHRRDFEISVVRIDEILDDHVVFTKLAGYSLGEWDNDEVAEKFAAAIAAAKQKATCYHCRCVHYAETPA